MDNPLRLPDPQAPAFLSLQKSPFFTASSSLLHQQQPSSLHPALHGLYLLSDADQFQNFHHSHFLPPDYETPTEQTQMVCS